MIIFVAGYLVLLLVLALTLDLRRGYLISSPLPMIVFIFPMLQFMAGVMSVVSIPFGIYLLMETKKNEAPQQKLVIAFILSTLPAVILVSLWLFSVALK